MKTWVILAAAASIIIGPSALSPCGSAVFAATGSYACCKVCKKGKACGDSCISRDKECHKGPGCACDG
jgi:hypothetical protein